MTTDTRKITEFISSTNDILQKDTHPIKVLLVDDQQIVAEAIRRALEGEKDISFTYCSNPLLAVNTAIQVSPTVILQDLVMPDMDGLGLIKHFRTNPATWNTPMVVLSSEEDPKVKAEAFALGANDYMVKIPDKRELIARIRYHSNAYIRLLERNEAYKKLEESQSILKAELADAAEYVKSLLPNPLKGEIQASWCFIPSTQLGGDAFGYHWLDDQHFAIYLLDVCGHGVGAALLSISVMNVLRSHTLPQTDFHDPCQVLSALNVAFPMENHNQMFFTIWYGVYNKITREIIFSSGGHPPAVLITGNSAADAKVHQLTTPGMVVGGINNAKFYTGKRKIESYNCFYLFSDGMFEIDKKDGTMMRYSDFIELLSRHAKEGRTNIEEVVEEIKKIHLNTSFADDLSIMQIIF